MSYDTFIDQYAAMFDFEEPVVYDEERGWMYYRPDFSGPFGPFTTEEEAQEACMEDFLG